MSELILVIFLGALLLLVILLLIWELVATYPVWKQFESFYSDEPSALLTKNKINSNVKKILLLTIAGAGLICLVACCFAQRPKEEKGPAVKTKTVTTDVPTKLLTATSADSTTFFRLQKKWQDGKLYGNSTIMFAAGGVQRLGNCRYYLLDKDGFLVKSISFSSDDFLFSTGPNGNLQSLVCKFNTEISIDDYLKIEKLQVALDDKVSSEK